MPSWKKVIVSGSDANLNSLNVATNVVAQSFSGSLLGTASYATNADFLDGKDSTVFATTGSNIFRGNQTVTGSLFTTGSNTLVGSTSLTGSLNITGSTTQVGNNTLFGNTLLSGSITISGSTAPGSPSASVQIYGDIQQAGYHRFDPVVTNIDNSISASYIYVSGSTQDLYFAQNSKGYTNTTRLRWLEGNLYTGLLNGGLITTQSSTIYQISSGSGIIVDLNASLNDNPYPTVQYLNWPNLSASIAPLTASYQQSFVSIDSAGNIYQQGTPYASGQFDTAINIGVVLFQNQSTINGVKTQPSLAYGFEQNQNIFNRAFGPLKLSGYTLAPSGSSTGSLIVASGTAYSPGSNYPVDPNNPSYATDNGTNISKIFRYHQSGSTWIYNTNAGAGFTSIDPTQYSNNGVLTAVPGGGSNRQWSIQRVFYFPNSVAKAIVVYYGNTAYTTEAEAISNISFESFTEAPNTAANAIYLGALVLRNDANFTTSTTYKILAGGLFRQVGGSGGGGSVVTQTLAGLSDVNISGPTDGQALVYNTTQAKWINASAISASITGNATTATSASFATTASYVLQAVSASFATSASQAQNATTASYVLNAVSASFATTSSYVLNAVSSSFATTASYVSSNFQYEIHVSQIDGNDTTGDGSLLKPVASITKALTLTTAQRKVIILHPGDYTENPTIPSGSITIQTTELTGGNTVLYGTLTIPTSGSGARISGFSMDNLTISGTAQAYVSNCTINSNVVKSSSGYVEITNSEMQCTSGIQISGAGTTIINGNKNVGILVSNASAQVIIKGCNSVETPSASAGNLAIVDCIVTAIGGNAITITGASTTLTLANSQVLTQARDNVAPISVEGIYSIINTIYDKPNSTLTGTSTNSVDYFQYINADNITTNGLTVTGSITVSGSVINTLTSSFAISASQATSASFATTSSYALNAVTASFVTASNVYGPFGSNSIVSASYALTASYALNGGGGGGANPTVTHTQLTASTTWSFNHNLNTQTPLLQVYDLGYEQIIPNEIVSIDLFTSEIRFTYTQAGYAVASTGGGLTITGSTSRLVQTVAATTWSFAHNLGTKYPGFEIFDSNDDVIIPAGIRAINTSSAEIYFAIPSTGVAIANFSGINGLSDNAVSASYSTTASYSDAFNIGQTQTRYATVTSSINGSNTVFTQATGSYTSAFFKYTVTSGSNARSGEIMSVWNGATAEFADNSTTDIGTTTVVTSSVALSGSNVQLNMQTNTAGWRIKSIATFM